MIYMNFIAAWFAGIGIGLNLFQSFINIPFIGSAGLIDILNLAFNGFIPVTEGLPLSLAIGIIFLVSIPVIAIIGAVRAIMKKGGYIFLALSAVECIIFALYLKFVVSNIGDNQDLSILANLIVSSFVPVLWAVFYIAASACAYLVTGKKIDASGIINKVSKVKIPAMNSKKSPASNSRTQAISSTKYEAMSLKQMLTEGINAIKTGDFATANEYFDHALIRNPKSSNAMIGKLMVKYKAKNASELVNAPVLLETEEFFQLALLSASPRMREVLEKYIRVNRLKRGN